MSIKKYQNLINRHINDIYLPSIKNDKLREIIEYSLKGGKRLRSMIVLDLSNYMSKEYLFNMALSIELLHNASLIMDDLPCMDNDCYRRGRECVHIKYGVRPAKLAAYYLFFESFKLVNTYNHPLLSKLVSEICRQNKLASYGQYFDLFNEKCLDKTINIDKINLKTSPFFTIAFLGGYLLSIDNKEKGLKNVSILNKIGVVFSNLFQIYDDFNDVEKDSKKENNINQVILFGREKAFELFMENISNFYKYLDLLGIKTPLMIEIIEYLKSKTHRN